LWRLLRQHLAHRREDQHRYGDHDQISRAADHRAVPSANGISLPPNGII
jgi:hypothetical protein